MMYVIYTINCIVVYLLGQKNPILCAFGITKDISPLLLYLWWEPVYYYDPDVPFPELREKLGPFADFADDIGDAFYFKVVTSDTEQVIYRSVLWSTLNNRNGNLRPSNLTPRKLEDKVTNENIDTFLNLSKLETQPKPNNLMRDTAETPSLLTNINEQDETQIPVTRARFFEPDDLIGKIYLCERKVDGTIHRGKIVERIENSEAITDQYLVKFGDGEQEEVMNYIVDLFNKQIDREINDPDAVYSFKRISDHCKQGNKYKALVEWECGETTWEPIALMRMSCPFWK